MGMQMKIILILLLVNASFCFPSIDQTPESESQKQFEAILEKLYQKNPQVILNFMIEDLKLHREHPKIYFRETAWRREADFKEYFLAFLPRRTTKLEDIEKIIKGEELLGDDEDRVWRFKISLFMSDVSFLNDIVEQVDIKPAFEYIDAYEKIRDDFGPGGFDSDYIRWVKLRREEIHGDRKKYLDILAEFIRVPLYGRVHDKFIEAAVEDDRFFHALVRARDNSRGGYTYILNVKVASHLRKHKGKSEQEILRAALYDEDEEILFWGLKKIKENKMRSFYSEILTIYNSRIIHSPECSSASSYLPFKDTCSHPDSQKEVKPDYKLREGF
jgi:hypothetical protein